VAGEIFFAAPDSLAGAPVDEAEEGTDVATGPCEQVVGKVGEHAGPRVSKDDLPLGGLDQALPIGSSLIGANLEGGHPQPCPPARRLGVGEESPPGQVYPGEQE